MDNLENHESITEEYENIIEESKAIAEQSENVNGEIVLEGNKTIKILETLKRLKEKICTKRNLIICAVSMGIIILLIVVGILTKPIIMYNMGKSAIENEQYEKAIQLLQSSKAEDTATYITYAEALLNISNKNYDDGINALKELGEFEKSGEHVTKAYYLKVEDLFANGEYASAKGCYKQTNGYEDSENKTTICDFLIAEKYYQDGYLTTAKAAFENLPSDFGYNDITVSSRLATLEQYKNFIDLIGEWKGTNGKMTVRQDHPSTGLWESWDGEFTDYLDLHCKINDDGSVTISGKAKFFAYTRYSSLSTGLNPKEFLVPIEVTVGAGEAIPGTLVDSGPTTAISPSGTMGKASVTYSPGKISLSFVLQDNNYSANFNYRYTSNITYTKQS